MLLQIDADQKRGVEAEQTRRIDQEAVGVVRVNCRWSSLKRSRALRVAPRGDGQLAGLGEIGNQRTDGKAGMPRGEALRRLAETLA